MLSSVVVGILQLPCWQTARSLLLAGRLVATPLLSRTWKSYQRHLVVTLSSTLIGSSVLILIICIRLFSFCPALVSSLVSLLLHSSFGFGHDVVCAGYWNEARILDPATFNTLTVLPNIPGSVNNCEDLHFHHHLR